MEETKDHAYRVEINRILQQVEKGVKEKDIALNSYPHIEKLQWLSAKEGSREAASAFFEEGNNQDMQDRKSTRLNSSHSSRSRMPSSA